MSLNHRQRHQLYRIEARLLRSDPRLASMLSVFGRLAAGQRLPAWEQVATRQDRIRQAAALIVKAITVMAAAIRLLLSAVLAMFAAVRALFAAVVMGGRARPPRRTYPQARPSPGADGRPDPAGWS
jgi:hypothetical protein